MNTITRFLFAILLFTMVACAQENPTEAMPDDPSTMPIFAAPLASVDVGQLESVMIPPLIQQSLNDIVDDMYESFTQVGL
tara:strand:- start:3692 stop:3931 length:240 start_codon:yes stop_codon:yes gene_type:complete